MADAGIPTPPPALPPLGVVPISYDSQVASDEAWAPLLKWLAVAAGVVSLAGVANAALDLLPTLGVATAAPYRGGPLWVTVLRVFPMLLLMSGAVGVVTRRELGRRLLVAYAFSALAASGIYLVMTQATSLGMRSYAINVHFLVRMSLSAVQSVGLPLLVLAIVRQPAVKRLFGRR